MEAVVGLSGKSESGVMNLVHATLGASSRPPYHTPQVEPIKSLVISTAHGQALGQISTRSVILA